MDHLYFTIQATEKYSAAVLHNKAPLSTFEATLGPPLAQLAETKPSLPRYHFDPTEISNIGFSATYIEENVLNRNISSSHLLLRQRSNSSSKIIVLYYTNICRKCELQSDVLKLGGNNLIVHSVRLNVTGPQTVF